MITGIELYNSFYNTGKCVLEKDIEKTFNNAILSIYPDTKIEKTFGLKTKKGFDFKKTQMQTDGIIQFNTGEWILQECKRDIGFKSIIVPRAFLQTMCYLSKYFDEPTTVRIDNFIGILLNSARFVCFIPRNEIINLMDEFIELYDKYKTVRPSEAYIIPEMNEWSIKNFNKITYHHFNLLDENFNFSLFINNIYKKIF